MSAAASPPQTTESVRSGSSGGVASTASLSSVMARWVRPPRRSSCCPPQGGASGRRLRFQSSTAEEEEEEEEPLGVEMLKKVVEKATYTRCYCEENVLLLCQRVSRVAAERQDSVFDWKCFAVFVSNQLERCPVWRQRAAADDDAPCVWDYHVVCYCVSDILGRSVVVDMDSTLPVVCDAARYVALAIAPSLKLPEELHPRLRVVPGDIYVRHFASDRRHMRGVATPEPSYGCICGALATKAFNLDEFKSMEDDHPSDDLSPRGVVMDVHAFWTWIDATNRDEPNATATVPPRVPASLSIVDQRRHLHFADDLVHRGAADPEIVTNDDDDDGNNNNYASRGGGGDEKEEDEENTHPPQNEDQDDDDDDDDDVET
ncbi:hypothetical protein CTAYLR_008912 [Chrysophaeum taylorii]|uniref:Protein N-terminal glutamine amidohydrolase n=1 Tax=Chrysophaeum taylorii TaxID=2483200 RepID=A0AAD7XKM2_9STRA|nr:hypothetical protein CTAYLR_008912 [Chrysophaeum taylorii]